MTNHVTLKVYVHDAVNLYTYHILTVVNDSMKLAIGTWSFEGTIEELDELLGRYTLLISTIQAQLAGAVTAPATAVAETVTTV